MASAASSDSEEASCEPTSEPSCCICQVAPRRYCCPKCLALTCSLQCCLEHKARTSCDGKRDITKFKHLAALTESEMRADYVFLESVSGSVDRSKRARIRECSDGAKWESAAPPPKVMAPCAEVPLPEANRPRPLGAAAKKLTAAASHEGVTLLLMPPGMSRSLSNTSCVTGKVLHWRIEFEFCGGSPATRLSVDRTSCADTWHETLSRLLGKSDASTRHYLLGHIDAVQRGADYRIFLRKEPSPANKPTYFQLDTSSTIRDSLRGKTIIEFPVIHVALAVDWGLFEVAPEKITAIEP